MKSERILRGHLLPASHSAEIEDEDGKGDGSVWRGGLVREDRVSLLDL
jgi:hypothetical protein